MAKYLILLLLLLLRISNVQAGCYYTQSSGGLPVYGSIFGNEGQTLQYCQQLACSIWPTMQGCPSTCQPETQTQALSCPSGYTGGINQTNTKSCPSGTWSGWVTTSNTCTAICQTITQTQTLSCPQGYTGSITQENSKTCPNNEWTGWVTTINSCREIPPRLEQQTLSCPVHQSGAIIQQRAYNYQTQSYTSWQNLSNTCVQDPPSCQASQDTKTESCGLHYTGQKTYTKQNTCPDPYGSPVQGAWILTSNTCVQDPPTCKITSETQNLQCQTGYIGLITQTRTSSCPDPYGQPVFAPWATISDTCKKSLSNPTNPTSPVSPISPMNPTAVAPTTTTQTTNTSAQTILSAPATAAVVAPTTTASQTTTTPTAPPEPPKGMNQKSVVGRVLSLEQKVGAVVQRMNPFPSASINQELPLEIRQNNKFLMDILSSGSITESITINAITKDTVEYEQ